MNISSGVTLQELSQKCGFSVGTMHRFVNNPHLLKTKTRNSIEHILEQIGIGTARSSHRQIRSIALLCQNTQLMMISEIISTIQSVCSQFDYPVNLVLVDAKGEEELEAALKNSSGIFDNCDAIIAHSFNTTKPYSYFVQKFKIPVIVINGKQCSYGISYDNNNYQGAKEAVQHLLQSGYKRIGFIGWNLNDPHLYDRYNGWKSVCQANNIEHEYLLAPITPEGGYMAGKELIKTFHPDAIFVACDAMALGAINYLDETPLKMGVDIGIMGFDNIYASNFIGLSTMHQLLKEKITQIMRYFIGFDWRNFDENTVQKISFTPVVIERKSTKGRKSPDNNTGGPQ